MKLKIGVSLAVLALATPAIAGEYYVDRCTVNHNEDWMLVFDIQHNVANFWEESDTRPVRYGTYYTKNGETYINVSNNTAASMDLKLRPNHDPSGNPVLEWTSGTIQSIMLCVNIDDTDIRPDRWVDMPGAVAEAAPPTTYPQPDTMDTASTCMSGSTGYPCDGSPASSTSPSLTVALSGDGKGGHTIDVTLGTSTPATMLIDTGATLVSLPQDVADKLVSVGEATVVGTAQFTIADGTSSTQNIIDIGKVTIGGRTLYHIKASVGPNGAMMLLGTNVLNVFGKYSIDAANNQLILG